MKSKGKGKVRVFGKEGKKKKKERMEEKESGSFFKYIEG